MKELEVKQETKLEIVANQKKQVEHQLITNLVPHEGHKIWEINVKTLKIQEAKYSNTTFRAFEKQQREIIIKEDCVYISALNKKNALKKAYQGKMGGKEYSEDPLKLVIYK